MAAECLCLCKCRYKTFRPSPEKNKGKITDIYLGDQYGTLIRIREIETRTQILDWQFMASNKKWMH